MAVACMTIKAALRASMPASERPKALLFTSLARSALIKSDHDASPPTSDRK